MFELKRLARIGLKRSKGSVNFVPEIVAGECDVNPGKRCDLGKHLGGNIDALAANIIDGSLFRSSEAPRSLQRLTK